MLLHEFFIKHMDEVNMGPGALQDFANTKFAQSMTAGFEAELVIPGAAGENEDYDVEPDYDYNPRANSPEDIVTFFSEGDYAESSREIQRVVAEIEEDFNEWTEEDFSETMSEELNDAITAAAKDDDMTDDDITQMIADGGRRYEKYKEAVESDIRDEYFERDDLWERWTRSEGLRNMSDFMDSYDLSWPNMTENRGGTVSTEEIAEKISDAVGMKVKASDSYHGATRKPGLWILEPDSSINTGNNEDGGLELISPPMPLAQCLEKMEAAFAWANDFGCSTNKSTGFHMGISIPEQTMENVDHLKFILFLGDEYVLKQFGRSSNTYATSMVEKIKSNVKANQNPEKSVEKILETFKQGLNSVAAQMMKGSITRTSDRYVSVNIKENYIEVRSAGGDYLGDFEKIKMTLLRYVRAMGLAADPDAERNEYAKKVYKLFAPLAQNDGGDTLKYFAQYSAGKLPATALKSFVRQSQMKRTEKRTGVEQGVIGDGPNLYLVKVVNVHTNHVEPARVRARSRREAVTVARTKFPDSDWNIETIKDLDVTDNAQARAQATANQAPLATAGGQPYSTASTWKITYLAPNGSEQTTEIDANSHNDAKMEFEGSHPTTYQITSIRKMD